MRRQTALAFCGWVGAALAPTAVVGQTSVPAQLRLGVERITLPGDEHLGLVGTSYLLDLGNGWSIGPGAYGAISGRRGGLFVVGAEIGWQHRLAGPWVVDTGFYAGGGGGGSAPVGGGLMLRPHADLLWDFGPFLAGVSASRVRFANGHIDSHQLGVVWNWKSDFRDLPTTGVATASLAGDGSGIGFDRIETVVGAYQPRRASKRINGSPLGGTIGLVGMRLERRLGDHGFGGIEAAGAGSGGVAGYAEYLATLGLETTIGGDALTLGGRVALGMGGGGGIDVGGGLLIAAEAIAKLRLTPDLSISLGAGVARAPQGSFSATRVSAALEWNLTGAGSANRITRTEWISGVERYRAKRNDGTTRPLGAVTLAANRFVSEDVYVSGQVHSGLAGGAGGYTAGLLGVGIKTPVWRALYGGAELLIGAAGGGGVSTQGGAVAQPSAYLGVALSPQLSLRLGGGRITAFRRSGALDANVVGASLVFDYGVSGR